MKQYLYQEKNGTLKATRYKPSYSDDEYTGFGHYYDKKTGKWLSGVALFADDFSDGDIIGWTDDNGVSAYQSGKIQITSSDTTIRTSYDSFTTVVGKKYKIKLEQKLGTAAAGRLWIGTSGTVLANKYDILSVNVEAENGSVEYVITAPATTTYINLGSYNGTCHFDNIAIIPLNDDGTIDTSNGTPVSPEITYTGQVVEVDTQGNPLYSDKFDVPTLQEEYIVADKVKADVLKLGGREVASIPVYEEGVWYPSGITGTHTALYTRIGNIVTITLTVETGSFASAIVSGLPYTAEQPTGVSTYLASVTVGAGLVPNFLVSGVNLYLRVLNQSTGAYSDLSDLAGTFRLHATYQIHSSEL